MDGIIRKFRYYTDKRFSTIAGTLVYFLLMSIAPFTLWLTLAFGNVNIESFFSHELFASVSPFLRYLKKSAESAASGAGIILLATSLYSSTNFFYHLRRSGEIIYDSPRVKGGLKLRLISVLWIFVAFVLFAVLGALTVTGGRFLELVIPDYVSDALMCIFITAVSFAVALVLNIFACPYKMKVSQAVTGSLLTTALWLIFSAGFAIYMNFANPERLYGKIAFIIVFLLWCYIMMCCLVVGMIKNGEGGKLYRHKTLL